MKTFLFRHLRILEMPKIRKKHVSVPFSYFLTFDLIYVTDKNTVFTLTHF